MTEMGEVAAAVGGLTIQGPATSSTGDVTTDPIAEATDLLTEHVVNIIEEAHPGLLRDAPLFDTAAYRNTPEVDGQSADKITVSFSGSISYEASDEEGKELFESLALGKAVELRVAGTVNKKAGAWKRSGKDGEDEVVTGQVGVKVETLYLLRPEEL